MEQKPIVRQRQELIALMAILPDCIEDLNNGAKKTPLDIRCHLKPSEGSISTYHILVGVTLRVTCPPTYPLVSPNITIEKSKGLSNEELKHLGEDLNVLARNKLGLECIYDLCQLTKEFLYTKNKELLMEREDEEEKREAERKEKERQSRELDAELLRRLSAQNPQSVEPSTSHIERSSSSEETSVVCSHETACSILLGSRQILRGKCLEHFSSNHSVHLGIDKENGKNYTIHEWILRESNPNPDQIKQIRAIEQEFNSSIKTLKHDNLVPYYSISSKSQEDYYIIHTVEEPVNGYNCNKLLLNDNIVMGAPYTKYIAKKVLEALDYLHSKNIVHRDLSSSCIYIDKKDVKVANYATYRRLSDLVGNKLSLNYNKKKDIEKFGNFVYSLITGVPLNDDVEVNIPVSLPPGLYEFLKMCKDEEQQYTVADLLKHQYLNRNTLHLEQDDEESEIPDDYDDFEMQRRNLIRNTSTSFDQSRISSEFELITSLGKGAFGSVHKYKNKLDERFYAIKKIQLNTKSKTTIKKIKNEVKLLSRLHHENVVRYFTSWIEEVEGDESRPSSCETVPGEEDEQVKYVDLPSELTEFDDIERLAPPVSKNKVSTTYSQRCLSDSDSDSDEEEEEEEGNISESVRSESDGIVFENSENPSNIDEAAVEESRTSEKNVPVVKKTYMYIQMEFCEKSTLRSAIDDTSLCSDEARVQRHFRQILEGLDYIHQQGMIHRDLKPANIFLDLRDRVKIGDFGLATSNLKSKLNDDNNPRSELDSFRDAAESKTGQVGTFFYVAPEVGAKGKVVYTRKVDIYSLGIILFEMCYKPFTTGMERYSVLVELRKKEINFPKGYESTLVKKYNEMIRWLLDHDVLKRPTVSDILKSELAPPPILEARGLVDMMSYTIANPQSNVYKSLIAKLFKQKLPLIKDLAYDYDESTTSLGKSSDMNYELVKNIAVKVFTSHGAKNMFTPLFMPFSNAYSFQNKEQCVKLMTHGGDIVSIPCDLRVHFARYVAWNSLYMTKRYSIERVYQEKKNHGFIPKASYECAFDIVTPFPGKSFLPDGEVLYAVYQVLNQLPALNKENIVIHINHTSLLTAILLHFMIGKEFHSRIIELFCVHEKKSDELNNALSNLKLSGTQINSLSGIFFAIHEPGKIPNIVKTIQNSKAPEAKKYAKQAEEELNLIIKAARGMGVEFGICIIPGLMYNFQQFSGMIFKFLHKKIKSKHGRMETLAAGGRYDDMITHYRNLLKGTYLARNVSQSAVGVSIFLDKVVQILQKIQAPEEISKFSHVLVCLEDEWPLNRLAMVLEKLSSLQIQWILFQTSTIKEADGYSEDLKIPHVVMLLKNYNENNILLKSWNHDRSQYREKKCSLAELVDELSKTVRRDSQTNDGALMRSESKNYVEKPLNDSPTIIFHTSVQSKKRLESQINSKLDDLRERYQGPIVVLAFNLDMNIIKTLVASLEFDTEKTFQKSMKTVVERNSKQKALQEICELIYEHKRKPNKPFVILYSIPDSSYRYV